MPKPMATPIDDEYTIKAIQLVREARAHQKWQQELARLKGSNALRTRMSAWWDNLVFRLTKEIVLP